MVSYYLGRQANILDYALGSLRRRAGRNSAVVIIFALVIFLVSSFSLLTTALRESALRLLLSVPDITIQQMSAGRQISLAESAVDELEKIFGIKEIRPRIWGYYFDETNGANYTVIGDPNFSIQEQLPGLRIDYSSEPAPGPSESGLSPVLLGEAVRNNLDLGNRRRFSLFRPDLSLKSFVSVGAFESSTALLTADLIVMDLAAARDLFAIPEGEVTDILVSVANPLEIETIAGKIDGRLDGVRVLTKERIAKTYRVAFGWRSGFGLACLIGAVAAFIILAWDRATGLSPDQKREVGILRALGWQVEDVITLRFWESMVICALAFGFGYVLAWIHLLYFDALLFRPVLLGWSVLRPPVSLTVQFRLTDLLIIFSLSVLPYLAATVVPAWRSATIRPDSVV